jgi:hypothetical protein
MALHEPFGHLQHKLCAKEGSGIKLAIWLPTTKSQESTRLSCMQETCDIPLKIYWQGLQLCFRPHCDQRSAQEVMRPQSGRSLNCCNFGTPIWESRDKKPFGCGPRGVAQSILYGGRWWLPLESGLCWVLWVQSRPWLILAPKVFWKVN